MSAHTATRSRWMDWKPKAQIFSKTAGSEPPKPTKTVFGVFVGAVSPESQKIEAAPDRAELSRASAVLARAGVRLMEIDGVCTVGVWSDLDSPEVRAALRVFGSDKLPIRYLDGDVPMKYKLRRVPGEPVPLAVLEAMLRAPAEPWVVLDKILEAMNWHPHGIPWAEWQAQMLNRLFLEQGVTGRRGGITAATVRHSERAAHLTEESGVPDGE